MNQSTNIKTKNILSAIQNGLRIFFLSLACSLAMAHYVLPHIHHDNVICFSVFQAEQCCDDSHHHEGEETNTHHHHGNLEDCSHESFLVRAREYHFTDYTSFVNLSDLYFIFPKYEHLPDCSEYLIPFREIPYFLSAYITQVNCQTGLRAPPLG